MIIKDEKIIDSGIDLFGDIRHFKNACSDYFKFKNKGIDDDAIQDFLDLSKSQIRFLSELWSDLEKSESYKKDPWVIIETNGNRWIDGDLFSPSNYNKVPHAKLVGYWTKNEVQENFIKYENFESKMIDFIYLRFRDTPLHEIQHCLELSDEQLLILSKTFHQLSRRIIIDLKNVFFKGV